MTIQRVFLFIVLIVTLSSCENKPKMVAESICKCNSALVEYNEKMNKFKEANDVNSVAELQPEGDRLMKEAESCIQKVETEYGRKIFDNKDFEVKMMKVLKTECPKVFEKYKNISLEEN